MARTDPLRGARHHIFILAGEPSGDLIAADVMAGLRRHGDVSFEGVGGAAMLEQGFEPLFDISELMVMGFDDVVQQLPRLLGRVKSTAAHILETQPDAVVLVDYQDFSTMLAKRLRRAGFAKPIILCVAPSVWAWRRGRARAINGIFDEVLAVLPMEPKIMAELGGPPTSYIGHRASSALSAVTPPERGFLMLLPGSRRGEIKRHMKVFRNVAERLAGHNSITGIVLPTLDRLEDQVQAEIADWNAAVDVIADRGAHEALYPQTTVALASSGTVTLELALRGIPFVGTYVPDLFQAVNYLIAGRPRILLPNVIVGAQIVPEELYGLGMTQRITEAMLRLIDDAEARRKQIEAFGALRKMMIEGAEGAKKQDAADRILSHLS